jgi:hypothetical protein
MIGSNNILDYNVALMICRTDIANLEKIFERLNKNGIPLKKYQIMAATWRKLNCVIEIEDKDIIKGINKYYDELQEGYGNRLDLQKGIVCLDKNRKECNLYEYFVGLKYKIDEKYDYFKEHYGIEKIAKKEKTNEYGYIFKLVAHILCNDTNKIDDIPYKLGVDNEGDTTYHYSKLKKLTRDIMDGIRFIWESIEPLLKYRTLSKKEKYICNLGVTQMILLVSCFIENKKLIITAKMTRLAIVKIQAFIIVYLSLSLNSLIFFSPSAVIKSTGNIILSPYLSNISLAKTKCSKLTIDLPTS